jgi:hypothetical protein
MFLKKDLDIIIYNDRRYRTDYRRTRSFADEEFVNNPAVTTGDYSPLALLDKL